MPVVPVFYGFYCPLCGNRITVSGWSSGYKPMPLVILGGRMVHIKCDKCNAKGVYDPRKEAITFKK